MLKKRSTQKEQLDNLEINGAQLHSTLDGLSVINKWLGNTNATFKAIKPIIIASEKAIKIVDLGCGGGDNLRAIGEWCLQNNQKVKLLGIDGNQNILDYAQSKNAGELQVEYLQTDILSETFELPECDVLISSHFMYHFSDEDLVSFMKKARLKVTTKMIFSELERNLMAYILFKLGSWLMPFTRMVKKDGLRAIERAFTKNELQSILDKSGTTSCSIQRKWAFRLLAEIKI